MTDPRSHSFIDTEQGVCFPGLEEAGNDSRIRNFGDQRQGCRLLTDYYQ